MSGRLSLKKKATESETRTTRHSTKIRNDHGAVAKTAAPARLTSKRGTSSASAKPAAKKLKHQPEPAPVPQHLDISDGSGSEEEESEYDQDGNEQQFSDIDGELDGGNVGVDEAALNRAKQSLGEDKKKPVDDEEDEITALSYLVEEVKTMRHDQGKIMRKLEQISADIEDIFHVLKEKAPATSEQPVPPHHIIDGENVMLWLSKDGQKFARDLMEKIFTRAELAGHICFSSESRPSQRQLLPKEKISLIVKLVLEKFPETNKKDLRQSMNQKCRDADPKKPASRQTEMVTQEIEEEH